LVHFFSQVLDNGGTKRWVCPSFCDTAVPTGTGSAASEIASWHTRDLPLLDWDQVISSIYILWRRADFLASLPLFSGAQPITDPKGHVALSVNGEIYNHVDLAEDLKRENPSVAEDFTTDSDCEVLLHLYKKHGPGKIVGKEDFPHWPANPIWILQSSPLLSVLRQSVGQRHVCLRLVRQCQRHFCGGKRPDRHRTSLHWVCLEKKLVASQNLFLIIMMYLGTATTAPSGSPLSWKVSRLTAATLKPFHPVIFTRESLGGIKRTGSTRILVKIQWLLSTKKSGEIFSNILELFYTNLLVNYPFWRSPFFLGSLMNLIFRVILWICQSLGRNFQQLSVVIFYLRFHLGCCFLVDWTPPLLLPLPAGKIEGSVKPLCVI